MSQPVPAGASRNTLARRVAWRVAPRAMADRVVRHQAKLRHQEGIEGASRNYVAIHGNLVSRGPFMGMVYPGARDEMVARLLGRYEGEIGPWIEEAISREPVRFIDLGTNDGYYAVGVKLASPTTDVYGFELSKAARRQCRELAEINGVDLHLEARATARSVGRRIVSGALLLSDIEGAEASVFTPKVVDALAECEVIIELHDGFRQGVTELICSRFERSHTVELVDSTSGFPEDRLLSGVSVRDRELMMPNLRTSTCRWGRFQPR